MVEWILGLWKTNKILFFILIIPAIIAFIYKILMASNVAGGVQDIKDAEKIDTELESKQKSIEALADAIQRETERVEKQIKEAKGDENWHKK